MLPEKKYSSKSVFSTRKVTFLTKFCIFFDFSFGLLLFRSYVNKED